MRVAHLTLAQVLPPILTEPDVWPQRNPPLDACPVGDGWCAGLHALTRVDAIVICGLNFVKADAARSNEAAVSVRATRVGHIMLCGGTTRLNTQPQARQARALYVRIRAELYRNICEW